MTNMTTATQETRVVPACSDCGTLGGRVAHDSVHPGRRDGAKYGHGKLCLNCYAKHYQRAKYQLEAQRSDPRLARLAERRAERVRQASRLLKQITCRHGRPRYRFAAECDLCGAPKKGVLYAGSEFDLEGKICRECRDELRDERAVDRLAELASKPYISPVRDTHGRRTIVLPVLTPGFTASELTPRAACRLMVAQFDRRVSEPRRISA